MSTFKREREREREREGDRERETETDRQRQRQRQREYILDRAARLSIILELNSLHRRWDSWTRRLLRVLNFS